MDLKKNQTRRTLGTRFVPLEMHDMSRSHLVSHQVKTNRSQLHQNVSLSQESSGNDTVRVKRHNHQLLRFFGIHVIPNTPPTTTVTPWVEA